MAWIRAVSGQCQEFMRSASTVGWPGQRSGIVLGQDSTGSDQIPDSCETEKGLVCDQY